MEGKQLPLILFCFDLELEWNSDQHVAIKLKKQEQFKVVTKFYFN